MGPGCGLWQMRSAVWPTWRLRLRVRRELPVLGFSCGTPVWQAAPAASAAPEAGSLFSLSGHNVVLKQFAGSQQVAGGGHGIFVLSDVFLRPMEFNHFQEPLQPQALSASLGIFHHPVQFLHCTAMTDVPVVKEGAKREELVSQLLDSVKPPLEEKGVSKTPVAQRVAVQDTPPVPNEAMHQTNGLCGNSA